MRDIVEGIFILSFVAASIYWRWEKWLSMLPKYNFVVWMGRKNIQARFGKNLDKNR